jgi:FeS assembly SUF system regulator
MIKLSRLTDYAVVILAEMAKNTENLASAAYISEVTNIPEPTVSKVLKLLAKSDIIGSTRGVNGGYALNIKSKDLKVTDVIEAMEGPISLTACVAGSDDECVLESMCALSGRWNPVNNAMKTALSQVSLADMTGV